MNGRGYLIAAAIYAAVAIFAAFSLAYYPSDTRSPSAPSCVIGQSATHSADTLASFGKHWSCLSSESGSRAASTLVRFDLADHSDRPRFIRSRIGPFERVEVSVVDQDGSVQRNSYAQSEVELLSNGTLFLIELPQISADSRAVFMEISGARNGLTAPRSVLLADDPRLSQHHMLSMLGIAILFGLVIAPVIFDLAFYGALKSQFLLWHAALSMSIGLLVLLRSGLVIEFIPLSMEVWRCTLVLAVGLCAYIGAKFTCAFVEDGMLDPRLRLWLVRMGVWALIASVIHIAPIAQSAPLRASFQSFAMVPVMAIFIAVIIDAYRKGSRAIRFQILGWTPLLFAFAHQLVSDISNWVPPEGALPLFYVGALSQTTITAIGVADRFFAMRRERDEALSDAIELEQLSVRDPLTGLLNRRAIDERFEELHRGGYETFALLDLDKFKKVNDNEGHATGDQVLRVVAQTLADDAGTIAIRMGGEEFLLMMRGLDAVDRAERLRQILSLRVARELPDLSQIVTGSMGILFAPRMALPKARFSDIYSRADMLLYEAKEQGRNRSVSEKLRAFGSQRAKNTSRTQAA